MSMVTTTATAVAVHCFFWRTDSQEVLLSVGTVATNAASDDRLNVSTKVVVPPCCVEVGSQYPDGRNNKVDRVTLMRWIVLP